MPRYPDQVARARAKMLVAHTGQTRWNGTPYSAHPDRVVSILRQFGITNPDVLSAAYLHDTLEDTRYSPESLATDFGDVVFDLVMELTFPQDISDAGYINRCRALSPDARLIKIADIIANLTDEGKKSEHYISKRLAALKVLRAAQ